MPLSYKVSLMPLTHTRLSLGCKRLIWGMQNSPFTFCPNRGRGRIASAQIQHSARESNLQGSSFLGRHCGRSQRQF